MFVSRNFEYKYVTIRDSPKKSSQDSRDSLEFQSIDIAGTTLVTYILALKNFEDKKQAKKQTTKPKVKYISV